MSLVEILVSAGLALLLGVGMLLAVLTTRRESRDAAVVSGVRQAQAAVEAFRARRASYPGSADDLSPDDAALAAAFGYQAAPAGCSAERADVCRSYSMRFSLEGRVGTLKGGNCQAGIEGLSCSE